jgi:phosphopantetheinyl transferase (holo-ACP synthase)
VNPIAIEGCVIALAEAGEALGAQAMTEGEQQEYTSLPTMPQRADYQASRLAAKRAITWSTPAGGADDAETLRRVSVRRREGAAPRVRVQEPSGEWSAAPVVFSLAHRDGHAVAVTAPPGARVGVDVERVGSVAHRYIRYFASDAECSRGPTDAASLWALKEAAWKALGLAQDLPFHSLEVEFDDARAVTGLRVDNIRFDAHASLLQPWPEHVVAVLVVDCA